jgi:hypothetical protein
MQTATRLDRRILDHDWTSVKEILRGCFKIDRRIRFSSKECARLMLLPGSKFLSEDSSGTSNEGVKARAKYGHGFVAPDCEPDRPDFGSPPTFWNGRTAAD